MIFDNDSALVDCVLHEHVLTQMVVPALSDEFIVRRKLSKWDLLVS